MLLAVLLLFLPSRTSPVPVTRNATTPWVGEPTGRGTWGLVRSCFITLGLCAYTAIHLNVRPKQSSKLRFARRFCWVIVATVAPEFVLVLAYKQWRCAKELQMRINNLAAAKFECLRCEREMSGQDSTTHNGRTGEPAVEPAGQAEGSPDRPIHPPIPEQETRPSSLPSLFPVSTEEASTNPSPGIGRATSHNPLGTTESSAPLAWGLRKWGTFHSMAMGEGSHRGSCMLITEQDNPKKGLWGVWRRKRRHLPGDSTWTIRQAYFVVAGGLVVDSGSFWETPYLTLTPAGVVELARLGYLPEVAEEVVEDKSKTDSLGKILVFFQASWFIIQCIARTVQGLPLSLLEVHVLAHVAVAFVMYLFWFKKPYNALSPIVLTDPATVELAALFALGQQSINKKPNDLKLHSQELKCCQRDGIGTLHVLSSYVDRHVSNVESFFNSRKGNKLRTEPEPTTSRESPNKPQGDPKADVPLRRCQSEENQRRPKSTASERIPLRQIKSVGSRPNAGSATAIETIAMETISQSLAMPLRRPSTSSSWSGFPTHLLPRANRVRKSRQHPKPDEHLQLAQEAVERLKQQGAHFMWRSVRRDGLLRLQNRDIYTVADCSDFYNSGGFILSSESFLRKPSLKTALQPTDTTAKFVIPLFILYGAFHLSAWNAHFPTPLERWMWRGAGLAILSLPAGYLALIIATIALVIAISIVIIVVGIAIGLPATIFWYQLVPDKRKEALKSGISRVFKVFKVPKAPQWLRTVGWSLLVFFMIILGLILYSLIFLAISGRSYFLIEAIISLRDPEVGTYNTTEWINFLPHG
ncbi:MAG: hypothetical protein M1839_008390 [Geoglossum umbratile]|nr:MAG: hypothetical protein M1839_008390 [Geoglossum umbratile]